MSIAESQEAALERLRMEFVHKASRVVTGSLLEEAIADAVTANLFDLLGGFDASMEPALRQCFEQIADADGYWLGLDTEFTFSRQSYKGLFALPYGAEHLVLPLVVGSAPASVAASEGVDEPMRIRLLNFLNWSRVALANVAMGAYTDEVRLGRPEETKMAPTHEYVLDRWSRFGSSIGKRWAPAILATEKQTCDWLRVAAFTLKIVTGVNDNRDELDQSLHSLEIGWSLERQVSVDRNILRMAAFELAHMDKVPASATINEAVELAKKYSTAESGKFVNGILGAIVARMAGETYTTLSERSLADTLDPIADIELDLDDALMEEEFAPA